MEILALSVAFLSFIISAITLYLTQLKSPLIDCIVGPTIQFSYSDFSDDKSYFNINLPVSFVNTSAKTGAIYQTAITLNKKDVPEQQFFMRADSFQKSWKPEEIATVIIIGGK